MQVSCLNAGPSQEIFSFSFGGSGDHLLAAGCKSQVMQLHLYILFFFTFVHVSSSICDIACA